MICMLCRNRVADYANWREVFDSHSGDHARTGLRLIGLWRDVQDANSVFFNFEVTDMERARAFISSPESEQAGKDSGVIDGEYHFAEAVA